MKRLLAFGFIVISVTTFAAPPSPMQDGLWEITSQTEIPYRQASAQPSISRACYTKQDVENETAGTPKDDRCEISEYQHIGNTATWRVVCIGKEYITGNGSVTFHDRTSHSGTVSLRLQVEGQPEIWMNNNYSAKRVGECPR